MSLQETIGAPIKKSRNPSSSANYKHFYTHLYTHEKQLKSSNFKLESMSSMYNFNYFWHVYKRV